MKAEDFIFIREEQYDFIFKNNTDGTIHKVSNFFIADITYKMVYISDPKEALELYLKKKNK